VMQRALQADLRARSLRKLSAIDARELSKNYAIM
jgi:hypothetical protein